EMLSQPSLFMDALDEFKLVSGLVPNIPKSKAYFCNVLNNVKLSLLNDMTFVEGKLPVKYLGLRDEEDVYLRAFNEATLDEERYLQQKAKIKWLRVRDSNSANFYKVVKGRNSQSRIEVIRNTNGFIHDGDQVPNIFIAHYNQFPGTSGETIPLDLPGLNSKVLDPNKAVYMVHLVLDEEVKQVVFSIGNNKAPG
nr:hypothetical protein [Tanacetum cinerariifolium]